MKMADFICNEINNIKSTVGHIEMRLNTKEKKKKSCKQRLTDLKRYSQWWNLCLQEREDVRASGLVKLWSPKQTKSTLFMVLEKGSRTVYDFDPLSFSFPYKWQGREYGRQSGIWNFFMLITFALLKISSQLIGKEDSCFGLWFWGWNESTLNIVELFDFCGFKFTIWESLHIWLWLCRWFTELQVSNLCT